jgi:(2Fe-2S) ferredoxin
MPEQERHILICSGPRCDPTRRRADELLRQLADMVAADPTLQLKCSRTQCMSACEFGPTLVVLPDDVWYRCEDSAALERIVSEHLQQGQSVTELVFALRGQE